MLGLVFFRTRKQANAVGIKSKYESLLKNNSERSPWTAGESLVQSSGVHRELQRGANTGDRSSELFTSAGRREDRTRSKVSNRAVKKHGSVSQVCNKDDEKSPTLAGRRTLRP